MTWTIIFRKAYLSATVSATVTVYDKGKPNALGRYCVAKSTGDRTTQTYYSDRPTALRAARKFLAEQAKVSAVEVSTT